WSPGPTAASSAPERRPHEGRSTRQSAITNDTPHRSETAMVDAEMPGSEAAAPDDLEAVER
ncbi:MAG: hypothetical protein KY458_13205, partial [Actinobacteria bacterium]|nr:hypothetical protein [Actinomycetota bacterium]